MHLRTFISFYTSWNLGVLESFRFSALALYLLLLDSLLEHFPSSRHLTSSLPAHKCWRAVYMWSHRTQFQLTLHKNETKLVPLHCHDWRTKCPLCHPPSHPPTKILLDTYMYNRCVYDGVCMCTCVYDTWCMYVCLCVCHCYICAHVQAGPSTVSCGVTEVKSRVCSTPVRIARLTIEMLSCLEGLTSLWSYGTCTLACSCTLLLCMAAMWRKSSAALLTSTWGLPY